MWKHLNLTKPFNCNNIMKHQYKNEIREKELNSFVIIVLTITALSSLFHSLANSLQIYDILPHTQKYIAYISPIGTAVNAFGIFYFILYKKSIVGAWIFYSMHIIGILLLLTPFSNYAMPNLIPITIGKMFWFSLVLLLRKNGESAWITLKRKENYLVRINNEFVESNEFNNQEQKSAGQVITYILTGVVVVLMIVAIIASI